MESFFARLPVRAATIDELLSEEFESLPHGGDGDLAAQRLVAWCRACAGGDESLFRRRLARDGISISDVLARLTAVQRRFDAATPSWLADAMWIDAALQSPEAAGRRAEAHQPLAFEDLLAPVAQRADAQLSKVLEPRAAANLTSAARTSLQRLLLRELSSLCAPVLYEGFAKARTAWPTSADGSVYAQFVADMQTGGFRRLFEDKPVLLRLMAVLTRQWIEASHEFLCRLGGDIDLLRRDFLHCARDSRIVAVEGQRSDPHHGGRSVLVVSFEDGARVVYKPKDLRADARWHTLVERLNRAGVPIELRAARALARDGYGWAEFVEHAGSADADGCARFFRRSGAWLALFHFCTGSDLHHENIIAAGEHPVPIDLEMILQAAGHPRATLEGDADAAARDVIGNSVLAVGLLPAYTRSFDHTVVGMGGMTSDWNTQTALVWTEVNSDAMRPTKTTLVGSSIPNLPHVNGGYARLRDYIDAFVSGFESYAKFLLSRRAELKAALDAFAGIPVRRTVRPTRFYAVLLQRLRDHRTMHDGVLWSAQADFIARLANWDEQSDPSWPLQRAERAALLALNVPHFTSRTDGGAVSGLARAQDRLARGDDSEIAWQVDVIRQSMITLLPVPTRAGGLSGRATVEASSRVFVAAADQIAAELSVRAIRRGAGAAWIGLAGIGDSDVVQPAALGPDLYGGNCGIALFLAAHAAVRRCTRSAELACAALAHVRRRLRGANAARFARGWGTGGATGLGSVVYTLAVMADLLRDAELLADAHLAADRLSEDLIAADERFDVIGGSAGAILGLLRLYRQDRSTDALARATRCGEHLLAQRRIGRPGSFVGRGLGAHPLNGMSHGAAGFAYALASLACATGRVEFAATAAECVAFEDASFDAAQGNWPDLRSGGPRWPCQWCHGAVGIGLARIGMALRGGFALPKAHIEAAVDAVERSWPNPTDTLCCGTLGSIEFTADAEKILARPELRDLAAQRMAAVLANADATGDFRWHAGSRKFNLGLFRGLAGVGYTALRRVDPTLPNVLIWE